MKKIRIIALIAAAVVFLGIFAVMNRKDGSAADSKVTVVVASREIASASVLTREMLTTKQMSGKDAPEDSLTDPAEAAGRIATAEIHKGEQLLQSNTGVAESSEYGLAVRLPKGMRAVTLDFESDAQGRLSNLLCVGNRVDVAAVVEEDSDGKAKTTNALLVLQNQEVVALNDSLANTDQTDAKDGAAVEKAAYQTVTLAVTPSDSLRLAAFQKKGSIRLLLRPQSDQEKKEIGAFTIS